ncbi:non-homologous end joining protein Ku [Paraburkholderia tropica]|uniref:Non-homologous end joining protein Ku n=1 Tax=Paraburkholderia tropica TaxID=92647 RepID=A0AAQ1JYQ7_9BURK|nr:Ku protein [Paraburkholderia tropica]RQN33794.1 Ku protein [Paraburkholderia tropica]SEK15678.1 DNA end-binding protein Ku [Paraburkholderia tropica]
MATARSIASLSLSFGLVSIPVRLYSATESSATIRFNMLAPDGSRVEQQYVSKSTGKRVERSEMNKGYEFEKGKFVVFTADELKALEESPSHIVEILAFVPDRAVDPIYYDKAYFVAPDKRGAKPYSLLQRALLASGRGALASWNNKGKTYMVQIRATDDGLVFQQLLWGAEVRSLKDLDIEHVPVSDAELKLALQIIAQGESETYDPEQYENVEQKRVLAAIDAKIEGQQIVAPAEEATPAGGQVIDLMDALRLSLTRVGKAKPASGKAAKSAEVAHLPATKRARAVKRAEAAPAAAPAKRARK